MIVDSHAHIWRPVAPGSSPVTTIVSGEVDISAAMFRECLTQHGVDRAVLVQPVYPGEDNSYVADAAAQDPDRFAAVCVVDPRKSDAAERLAYWVTERGCRGLRLRPKVAAEEQCFGDPSTFPLWQEAARLEIAINVLGNFEHLGAVATLAERFPAVPIIIDHLAHPPLPLTAAELAPLLNLAQFPRVYAKVSGYYYFSQEAYPHRDGVEVVRAAYDRFGAERLLWGSDFPHVTLRMGYGPALAMVEAAFTWLSAEERQRILGQNSLRLYWPGAI
jgi:L-fuconolactonase